jgi:O-antigen/teichoic acid export membrane protein
VRSLTSLRSLFSDTVYVVAAKVFGGASVLLLNLYLIRVLEPRDYGTYVFCTAALLLLDGIICTSIDLAVLRVVSSEQSAGTSEFASEELAGLAIKGLAVATLLLPVLFFGGRLGQIAFHRHGAASLLGVTVLSGGMQMVFRSMQLHYQVQLKFRLFGLAELLHALVRVLLILGSVRAGNRDVAWLIACYSVAPLLVMFGVGAMQLDERLRFAPAAWRDVVGLTRTIRYSVATLSAGGLISRLDILILAFTRSPAELGVYGAAQSIVMIPEILAAYLAPVFTPRIMPLCREGKFYAFYLRFYMAAYTVALIGIVLAIVASRPLLMRVYPAAYEQSGVLVQWLLPGAIASFLLFPLTLNFMLFFAPRSFLWYDLCSAPFLGLAYFLAAIHSGVLGVAVVTLISRVLKTMVMQMLATRLAFRVGRGMVAAPPENEAIAGR